MISLIWAMDENRLIGNKNLIPWHVKEDLLYYKAKTKGQIVFMGDVTYYSLKSYYKDRPLPYGKIYVASLDKSLMIDEAIVVNDASDFLRNVKEDLFVVGGSSIYKIALEYADKLYISIIKGTYQGDTYFPEFDIENFKLISTTSSEKVDYLIYERR